MLLPFFLCSGVSTGRNEVVVSFLCFVAHQRKQRLMGQSEASHPCCFFGEQVDKLLRPVINPLVPLDMALMRMLTLRLDAIEYVICSHC